MAKQVETTYGNALFELAIEEGKIDDWYVEVLELTSILKKNKDLIELLNHPQVDKLEKEKIIKNIFEGKISNEILGLIVMIMDKGHISKIVGVFRYFIKLVKEHKNIGVAKVTSATVLTEAQKSKIENRLIETTSYSRMEVTYKVDESLIGGLVIRIGDRVVDSSIKTKLETLSKTLANA
ncbi:MAG: ATP synthase F1 subunit delta [Lachnospiraceae bacterium]|nr:ATP synthase F1 subunit delta [Lachnospiraceae bacterium]